MIKEIQFHVFETKTRKEVNKFMRLSNIINKIKQGDEYTDFIRAARAGQVDMTYYQAFESQRECILWNANSVFSKTADKKVMLGLVHMHKDNMDEVLIGSFKGILKTLDCVVCVFTSIDGKGIECLVRRDGVTPKNFERVWQEINDSIGLEFTFTALENSEPTLISYDPSIYFNPMASSFQAKKPIPIKAIKAPPTPKNQIISVIVNPS